MEQNQEVVELLREIAAALRIGTKTPVLWDIHQIAQWLNLDPHTVKLRVVSRPGFPRPAVPTGSDQGQRRWFASEVIDWLHERSHELPRTRRKRGSGAAAIMPAMSVADTR